MKNKIYPFKKLLDSYKGSNLNYKLPVILGVDENGKTEFADLTDLEHILMTGSTGSGKSVFMSSMIATFLSLFSTHQLRLMLVDMKRLELTEYEGLPYLLSPVAVETDRVYACLQWLIDEKTRRLKIMAEIEKHPFLVIFIDTFSDLMNNDSDKFQDYLSKLMHQASDVKIHIIMSDSRQSPDLDTPLIRELFPTKICFNVTDSASSQLIIGKAGGEKLRGVGDMIIKFPDGHTKHIQAPFISDEDLQKLIKFSLPKDS